MKKKLAELAFQGNWKALLILLLEHTELINVATETKGYTPLHQAAWHGASPSVIGQLLALGADPTIRTINKNMTAREIAAEKYESRMDLQFLLSEKGRTLGQLIRKIVAESPDLFAEYDGNQVLCDRLIESFSDDSFCQTKGNYEDRLAAAFKAFTGMEIFSNHSIACRPASFFNMQITPDFWANRFLRLLRNYESRACTIPIEKHWAVVSDLFDPPPSGWGLRGDLFLWMEMRQVLCHVPIPREPDALNCTLSCAFTTLTGNALSSEIEVYVPRLARGGMSSGMVSGRFWNDVLIPMIQQRALWLQEAWSEQKSESRAYANICTN